MKFILQYGENIFGDYEVSWAHFISKEDSTDNILNGNEWEIFEIQIVTPIMITLTVKNILTPLCQKLFNFNPRPKRGV